MAPYKMAPLRDMHERDTGVITQLSFPSRRTRTDIEVNLRTVEALA